MFDDMHVTQSGLINPDLWLIMLDKDARCRRSMGFVVLDLWATERSRK